MILEARAKLNLYLDITGRRADGYHLLETVMQSISISDRITLEISGSGGIEVSCDDSSIPCGESNIAYKAAAGFLKETRLSAGVSIAIKKRIPSGAGMGGGSADAAAVLAGLNRFFGEPLDGARLNALAAKIGADVPFCLAGGTKLCRGIGEEISAAPSVKDCRFLVVKPEFSCSTPLAYARYDGAPAQRRGGLEEFCAAVSTGDFPTKMYNVFRELYADERIDCIISRLKEHGAAGAMLTGSGAAVFGVFYDKNTAESAANEFTGLFTAVCAPAEEGIRFVSTQ